MATTETTIRLWQPLEVQQLVATLTHQAVQVLQLQSEMTAVMVEAAQMVVPAVLAESSLEQRQQQAHPQAVAVAAVPSLESQAQPVPQVE